MRDFDRNEKNEIQCDDEPGLWLYRAVARPNNFVYFGEDGDKMFSTWALGPVFHHRDSGILDQANARALLDFLKSDASLEGEYRVTNTSHWAVGWAEHLSFHAFEDEEQTRPTRIARILAAWFAYLKDEYPIADEDLFSTMEHEASCKWIEEEGPRVAEKLGFQLPDDWYGKVMDWWDAHDSSALESVDDQGASPTSEQFQKAFEGCGFGKDTDVD